MGGGFTPFIGQSHIEFREDYLLEEEEDRTQHLLAQTVHFVPADVIALKPQETELGNNFREGLSFVFDEGEPDTQESRVEISSGLILPRDLGDSDLGVHEEDLALARLILGGFARFIRSSIVEE